MVAKRTRSIGCRESPGVNRGRHGTDAPDCQARLRPAAPIGCDVMAPSMRRGLTFARHRVNAGECNAAFTAVHVLAVHPINSVNTKKTVKYFDTCIEY